MTNEFIDSPRRKRFNVTSISLRWRTSKNLWKKWKILNIWLAGRTKDLSNGWMFARDRHRDKGTHFSAINTSKKHGETISLSTLSLSVWSTGIFFRSNKLNCPEEVPHFVLYVWQIREGKFWPSGNHLDVARPFRVSFPSTLAAVDLLSICTRESGIDETRENWTVDPKELHRERGHRKNRGFIAV